MVNEYSRLETEVKETEVKAARLKHVMDRSRVLMEKIEIGTDSVRKSTKKFRSPDKNLLPFITSRH